LTPDSRLARLMAVLLGVVRARFMVPFPVTREGMATVVQAPPLKAPDEPIALPMGSALW